MIKCLRLLMSSVSQRRCLIISCKISTWWYLLKYRQQLVQILGHSHQFHVRKTEMNPPSNDNNNLPSGVNILLSAQSQWHTCSSSSAASTLQEEASHMAQEVAGIQKCELLKWLSRHAWDKTKRLVSYTAVHSSHPRLWGAARCVWILHDVCWGTDTWCHEKRNKAVC